MKRFFHLIALSILIFSVLSLTSCMTDEGLNIFLTSQTIAGTAVGDAYSENVLSIVVTITGLQVHRTSADENSGWAVLDAPEKARRARDIQGRTRTRPCTRGTIQDV